MDSAIAGLIGVGVGAGLTLLNEKLKWNRQREADDLKWMRESQVRYNSDRVEAYAAFLRAGKAVMDSDWKAPVLPDETEFTVAYYRIELLAFPPVRTAAAAYKGAINLPLVMKRLNLHFQTPQGQQALDILRQSPIQGATEPSSQDPATARWLAESREKAASEPIFSNGKPSISTLFKVSEAEKALMEAMREELGVASLSQVIPETGKPTGPHWRPFRRKPRKGSAAPGNTASSENAGR